MAAATIDRVTSRLMREIRDSAYDQERRNMQHEANQRRRPLSWKLERSPNQAGSWEYKVVTRGWTIGPQEKKKRLILGRIGCYARTLERLFEKREITKRKWNQPKWNERIKEAIQGLIQLRSNEQSGMKQQAGPKPTTIETNLEQRRQRTVKREDRSKRKQQLYGLWKEFVISSRIKEGLYSRLPTIEEGRCQCGRARISYPHWPPTSTNEADAQFEYCIDERNEHRRHLVIDWWRHFNDLANIREWTASEPQQRYRDAEAIIREESPIVQQELERSTRIRKRPKGWSCREYCEKVLEANRCECLCFCSEHRDECPTYSQQ
jgi:hypothetical protein